jgi:TolB-like protein/DNA-binding winged helix-turn-helix (wHTH) protein/Tfp pilus assembly protein PilF
MDAAVAQFLHFESFTLDLRRRCLLAGDRAIELRPKSFDVLCYLAEQHGKLATKEEIIGAVWPNVVATDESLSRCVSDIRQVLGEAGTQVIKTVPGRGYVFVAPVTLAAADQSSSQGAASPPQHTVRSNWYVKPVIAGPIVLAMVVLLIAFGVLQQIWNKPSTLALPDRPSIAVLPFKNMSGDAGQDYFGDGLSQDLTTSLSKFREVFVIAANSASRYKGKKVHATEIGRRLGVRYLLEGSVRKVGERMRVTARLTDTTSDAQIWAENYDLPLSGIFAVQDDVTQKIVTRLVSHINKSELDRVAHTPVAVWAAYDHTLRGNAIMKAAPRDKTGAIVIAARSEYEKALTIDPDYAPALQGLALTYWTSWLKPLTNELIKDDFNQQGVLDRAQQLAYRAVAIDPTRAKGWATLGWILHWQRGPSAGLGAFERAVALNPNFVDGRFAFLLACAGRPAKAIEYVKHAMRLDPLYPLRYRFYLGLSLFLAGQYEEAIEHLREVAHRLPGFPARYEMLAAVAAATGRDGEAHDAATKVLTGKPDFTVDKFLRFMRLERQEDSVRLTQALRMAGFSK